MRDGIGISRFRDGTGEAKRRPSSFIFRTVFVFNTASSAQPVDVCCSPRTGKHDSYWYMARETIYANALLFHLVKAKLCNISLILWLITWVFSRKAFSQVMELPRESLFVAVSLHYAILRGIDCLPAAALLLHNDKNSPRNFLPWSILPQLFDVSVFR